MKKTCLGKDFMMMKVNIVEGLKHNETIYENYAHWGDNVSSDDVKVLAYIFVQKLCGVVLVVLVLYDSQNTCTYFN